MKLKTLHISLPVIFLFLIILSTILLRMRLLDVPLERDEGEYAYIGQRILDGTPPYSEAYNMKFPGIYLIYAGILWLFGETHTAIHVCLLIVNVLSIILLFLFARTAYDDWIAAAAASAFALLSMSYHVQGLWANAEHFILPFVIGANLLLLIGLKKKRKGVVFLSALLFGCAGLVKQHGAFFGIFGFAAMLILLWKDSVYGKDKYWKYIGTYCGGIILPVLLCFFYLAYSGVLEKFYLWTFMYARNYSSILSIDDMKFGFIGGFQSLFFFASPIWIMGGVGCITLFFRRYDIQSRILTGGLLLAGIIALSIGLYFRPHYFVFVLPAVALLFGLGIRFMYNTFAAASSLIVRYGPPTLIVAVALLGTLAAHWDVLVQFSLPRATETVYHNNPFPYSMKIAEIIKEKTSTEDRIAIFGNEPQILFYSHRKSATPFIYLFSLVEDQPFAQQFRDEMMHQVESASPKILVFTRVQSESGKRSAEWEALEDWFFNFAGAQYTLTARFEYLNITDTVLVTDPVLLAKKPAHLFWISIYEKRKE
jgi:4-amino-4-deoxy-L-arabinose transferase-like glycosyltransferase